MSKKLRAILTVSFLFFLSLNVAAEPQTLEEAFSTFQTAAMRTWRTRLLPGFRKVIDSKYREQLSTMKFKVIRFADFNAFSNYDRNSIAIPAGFLFTLDALADATTLTWYRPKLADKLKTYPLYLADLYRQAANGKKVNAALFPEYAGFPMSVANSLREEDEFYNLKVGLLVDSLALIVGHEIGHLVLGHKPSKEIPPSESRTQEYKADAFGMKLSMDAGFLPVSGLITTFIMFAAIDGGGSQGAQATHPSTICRISKMIDAAFNQIDSPEAQKGLKRMGMNKETLLKSIEELKDECEKEGD